MGPSVIPVSSCRTPTQTHQIPNCRWTRLHRHRGPHTHLSDRHGGVSEQSRHQRVRLGQGGDRTPPQQATRRHAQDKSAADWEGRQISLHLDQEPQPSPLRPEQTQSEEVLLWALSSWVQARGSAGSSSAGVQGNRAESRQGGDAWGGQEQAHLPEPPQAAACAIHYLRRLWSPHHESRRARARSQQKQHPEDTSPRGMQLLLCQGAVRRTDRGEPSKYENDQLRLGEPQDRAQMLCVWRPPERRLRQGPLPHHR